MHSTPTSTSTADADGQQQGGQLRRSAGRKLVLLFVVGNLLGAGIYAIIGEVAGATGGALWMAFVAAAVLSVPTLFAYLELMTKFPQAGGAGLYAAKAFDRPWLTVVVTVAIAASALTSAATSARAFAGGYLGAFVDLPVLPVAVAFVLVLAAINLAGISESLKATAVMAVITIAGLLLVVGVGVAAIADGSADPSRLTQVSGGATAPLAVLGGAALAFFAFIGFEDTAQIAEEVEEPHKTLRFGVLAGVGAATAVYVLVAVAASLVLPAEDLAGSSGPLLQVVQTSAVPGEVLSAVALIALAKTALVQQVAASRVLFGVARRGLLPAPLTRVWASRGSPWVAVVVVGAIAALLVATGDLGGLADTTVMLLLTVFVLVDVAVLRLRREPVDHEHVRAPTWLPVLGAAVSALLVIYTGATNGLDVTVRYLLLLGGGLVVYGVQRVLAPHVDALDADRLDPDRD